MPSGYKYHRTIDPPSSPNYISLLGRIHRYLTPSTYVEIGVYQGASLRQTLPQTIAVGIDPILKTRQPAGSSAKLFPLTSDEFFAKHDLRAELSGQSVELAFIDGMHLFEFALRDFMNLERFCDSDSTILLHDCHPQGRETAGREPTTPFWSGDVWKLVLCLNDHRPELGVYVVDVPPSGLGIVTNLDPSSNGLMDQYAELCEAYRDLDYSIVEDGNEDRLNLVPNDWERVREILS